MKVTTISHKMKPPDVRRYRGWWWRTLIRSGLFLGMGLFLIYALGQAQRFGWIRAGVASKSAARESEEVYTCAMHPHVRLPEPGRCPECPMALVKLSSLKKTKSSAAAMPGHQHGSMAMPAAGQDDGDSNAVTIDPVARRLVGIRTAPVERKPVYRSIRAPGTLAYDETRLETIITYVDGRIEEQYADFTGFKIAKKSKLVKIFSPRLEEAQVAYLEAKRTLATLKGSGVASAVRTHEGLVSQFRRQLKELGMTEAQILTLQKTGMVESRIVLHSTVAGTIVEKSVSKGDEIKAGQKLYKIANLETVWLLLDLFPDDAARILYGQLVDVEVRSLPGIPFSGRVSFIAPEVSEKTRTVHVRVEMKNVDGQLRPGDLAKARIRVPFAPGSKIYDEVLIGKWMSPAHPEEIFAAAGNCPRCGRALIPTNKLGFAQTPDETPSSFVVPRSAVLHVGDVSIVYVETDPGRFELRPVELAGMTGDVAVLVKGVREGEQVATAGNFLIDSQMQLESKPSLIDTSKYKPNPDRRMIEEYLAKLSPQDRKAAEQQEICPVERKPLGWMGKPVKVQVNGRKVFICCTGCEKKLKGDPDRYLRLIPNGHKGKH